MKTINTMSLLFSVLVTLLLAVSSAPLYAEDATTEKNEAQLIAVLESEAGIFDKAKACQRLAVIGGKDAVPALAKLSNVTANTAVKNW